MPKDISGEIELHNNKSLSTTVSAEKKKLSREKKTWKKSSPICKKWWWLIFKNFVDVAKVNAWLINRICIDPNVSLLDFQRQLVISLLKTPTKNESSQNSIPKFHSPGHPSSMQNILLEKRMVDFSNHMIDRNPENKRR